MRCADVGTAVSEGAKPLTALAVVVGLAVLREGSEVVLFLYGIIASGTSGSAAAARRRARHRRRRGVHRADLFRAAGDPEPLHLLGDELADRAARRRHGGAVRAVPQQRRLVEVLDRTVWDTSWLLSEGSMVGRLLHTLIGYTERPTELQLMVYIATLIAMFLLMRIGALRRRSERVAV